MPTSPLQRTLKVLRGSGWTVGITEHWNQHVKIRQDLFGFADCIAFKKGFPVLAVNAMHMKHRDDHEKLRENEALYKWIDAGNRFALYQWHKIGRRWHVYVREWTLDDMRLEKAESSGEPFSQEPVPSSGAQAGTAATESPRTGRTNSVPRRRTNARGAGAHRSTQRRGHGQAHDLGDANRK